MGAYPCGEYVKISCWTMRPWRVDGWVGEQGGN